MDCCSATDMICFWVFKFPLSYIAWALVAAATFLIGTKLDRSDETESAQSRDQATTLSSRSSRADNRGVGRNIRGGKTNPESRRPSGGENRFTSETPLAELRAALKSGDLVERRLAFTTILEKLTPENARELRELIADLPQSSSQFRDEFHYAWGIVAGVEALNSLNDIDPDNDMAKNDKAAEWALTGWASQNPSAALTYFEGLSPEEQNNASLSTANGLADADLDLAVKFALAREQSGDKYARDLMIGAADVVLRSKDPTEAAEWASAIPEGPLQSAAFGWLAKGYARTDPAEAVAWATNLLDGNGKNSAMRESFNQWAGEDPQAAANRLNSLPESPARDSATYGYATSICSRDPLAAVDWATSIQNADSRNRALVDVGRVFCTLYRDAANEWIATAGLPEDVVRKITPFY